ncbi:MAG: ATP-binding protein [Thalassovita sp.]
MDLSKKRLRFMQTERDLTISVETGYTMNVPHEFKTCFPATELAVREALVAMNSNLKTWQLDETDIGRVEIVLAEALNNVVEHAYALTGGGTIELRLKHTADGIDVTVLDSGVPVPVHVFAKRTGPDVNVATDDLPEGGFGWMLIQHMSSHLSYQRVGDTNCLRLTVPLDSTD